MSTAEDGDDNSEYENYDGESFENDDFGVEKQPRFTTITDVVESLNKPNECELCFYFAEKTILR